MACALAGVAAHGAAADAARELALVNPGFEAPAAPAQAPPGWVPIQHVTPDAYAIVADDAVRRSGARSVRIEYRAPEPFGAIVQAVTDPALRGRSVRFTGWLRTRDAKGGAVLIVQAMRGGVPIAYDHMRAAAVKGTTDWQRYAVTLAVPGNAEALEVGAMLLGPGTLWFDDASLEVIAR